MLILKPFNPSLIVGRLYRLLQASHQATCEFPIPQLTILRIWVSRPPTREEKDNPSLPTPTPPKFTADCCALIRK
jgi:hypothetical protein